MKRLHVALAVKQLEPAIVEYTKRLGAKPVSVVDSTYALWRTDQVNLSISVKPEEAGTLRHLGFEDPTSTEMSVEYDGDGFMWERFTAEQQREEIFTHYPDAEYPVENL